MFLDFFVLLKKV